MELVEGASVSVVVVCGCLVSCSEDKLLMFHGKHCVCGLFVVV